MKKKPLFIITFILAIISIPIAAAASDIKPASEYLGRFVDGLTALFQNNTSGFVQGLTDSFPLFAVFLIILGIVQYVSKKVIFTEDKNTKYATILAVGMALIAVWSNSVFQWIIGLGTTTMFIMITIVMLAFLYEALGAHKTGLTSLSNANTMLANARTAEINAVKDKDKATYAMNISNITNAREMKDLTDASQKLDEIVVNTRNVHNALITVISIIKKLASGGTIAETGEYRDYLGRQLAAVNAQIIEQGKDVSQVHKSIANLKLITYNEANNEYDETVLFNNLMRIGKIVHNGNSTPAFTQIKQKFIGGINATIAKEKREVADLAALEANIQALVIEVNSLINQSIQTLGTGQYNTSIQLINNALVANAKIDTADSQARMMIQRIYQLNTEEQHLIAEVKQEIAAL